MAQHDYDIANQTFPNFRTDLNNALQALISNNSGGTAPTSPVAGMFWLDTSGAEPILKIRNAANNGWLTITTIGAGFAGFLPLTGGTLTGALVLPAADPTTANDASRKAYVDAQRDTRLALTGGTLTGALTLHADPTSALHAATKQYADSVANDATRLMLVQDRKAANVDGGTSTSNVWNVRTLNHVVFNGIADASLSSNRITLPAGTYNVRATAVADRPYRHRLRLWNTTASAQVALGLSHYDRVSYSDNGDVGVAQLEDRFTLSGSGAIELQHFISTGRATTGFGIASDFNSQQEIYASVHITKVA